MNTDNQKAVYECVKKIPKGRVATYGMISKKLGLKSPRIVGKYLHENKNPQNIPCHRVVFSDGKLSPNYAYGGYKMQRQKLINEGVIFKNDRVDTKRFIKFFK